MGPVFFPLHSVDTTARSKSVARAADTPLGGCERRASSQSTRCRWLGTPRAKTAVKTDGIVGIRINHLLDVQVEEFEVRR